MSTYERAEEIIRNFQNWYLINKKELITEGVIIFNQKYAHEKEFEKIDCYFSIDDTGYIFFAWDFYEGQKDFQFISIYTLEQMIQAIKEHEFEYDEEYNAPFLKLWRDNES